jgi:hypothetical protein
VHGKAVEEPECSLEEPSLRRSPSSWPKGGVCIRHLTTIHRTRRYQIRMVISAYCNM